MQSCQPVNELCSIPDSEKFLRINSYSLTLRPASISCSAFSPRTVTKADIFSFRRIPNRRTVYLALPYTGCWPVSCSSTCNSRVLSCKHQRLFRPSHQASSNSFVPQVAPYTPCDINSAIRMLSRARLHCTSAPRQQRLGRGQTTTVERQSAPSQPFEAYHLTRLYKCLV